MRQFRTLLGYELKKILQRKSTWVCMGVILAFYALSQFLIWGTSTSHGYSEMSSDGQIVEDSSYTETYAQAVARQRRDALSWSGRKLDDTLMQEVAEKTDELDSPGMTQRQFNEKLESYRLVFFSLAAITGRDDDPYSFLDHMNQQNQEAVSRQRQEQIAGKWQEYGLTEKEMSFWQKKEDSLTEPFTLQYSGAFDSLVTTQGIYMALMLACFFIAVTVSEVFAQEHTRKTDQLILSSRLGRRQLYFTKLLAGALFSLVSGMILTGIIVAVNFMMYGTEGFTAVVQWKAGWYSYPLTMGKVLLILIGLELLATVLTGVFTMVVSEGFQSSLIAMAIVIGGTFAARLIQIPLAYRLLSQIWNYFPINLIYFYEGFLDLRMVSVFGISLTSWQFAPILYLAVGGLLVFIGKRLYCNYQVEG